MKRGEHDRDAIARRHLRIGWWGLLAFVGIGFFLETILGLRLGWYVDEASATRRLMFTLGHAHGALLCLINVAFALTLHSALVRRAPSRWASPALLSATVLIPSGFLGGGIVVHDGDPSLLVLLVPIGALLLVVALFTIARALTR